ncbi:MAG: DUF5655 domain-containing protein [Caldilineaceae bacterium]
MAEQANKIDQYLEQVQAKTGKTVADFRQMAEQKGIKKTAPLVKWLSEEYGLGYHEAGAINYMLFHADHAQANADEKLTYHFTGNKAIWREACEAIITQITDFGPDVEVSPNTTYINLQRRGKKFALLQISASRLDIGIKRKGVAPTGRFEAAGSWNAMVTHRLRINNPQEVDDEVIGWLKQAYDAA